MRHAAFIACWIAAAALAQEAAAQTGGDAPPKPARPKYCVVMDLHDIARATIPKLQGPGLRDIATVFADELLKGAIEEFTKTLSDDEVAALQKSGRLDAYATRGIKNACGGPQVS